MVYIGELWLLWAKKFVGMKDFKSSLEDRLTTISIKRYSCSGISAVSVWDAGSNSLALLEEFTKGMKIVCLTIPEGKVAAYGQNVML